MHPRDQSVSGRAYRLLLRALPFDFRGDYGDEMEEVFRAQRADAARKNGAAALIGLWWETIAGIFRTAPREHLAILEQDARLAFRTMRRERAYTALAIIILALGIGANTALFSVIHAILIRPLPYSNGSGLVMIRQTAPLAKIPEMPFSVAEINDYRLRNHTLASVAEYHSMMFTLLGEGEAERVRTGVVSADFFEMFGVTPALGRGFVASDDRAGAPAVLLMSHEYWRKRGADPNIVGKVFRMNDREHVVIGVLPPVPQYPTENDVFMPVAACPFRTAPPFVANRGARMMRLFGRMKPGVTVEETRTDLAGIAGQLQREYPDFYPPDRGYGISAALLKRELTQKARPMLWLLMGAASFVLLIACANVANLMLARVARREHELVVRSAMGAANSRILRQFLTENLIVAGLAAGVGVFLASVSMRFLTEFAARLTPRAREISLDQTALFYAIAIAVLTSLVFGSLAALSGRGDLASGLKDNPGHSTWGPRGVRLRDILVTSQVAFSFVLLIGAGLMARSVTKLQHVDPGFATERVLAVGVNLNWTRYQTDKQRLDIGARLLEKLRGQPGIVSAALSSGFPLDPEALASGFWRMTFRTRNQASTAVACVRMATSAYFETLGVPIIQGRAFAVSDGPENDRVAIVNESLAGHYFSHQNPVGEQLSLDQGDNWVTIVGVARDVKEYGPGRDAPDELYLPSTQHGMPIFTVLVRSTEGPEITAAAVRKAIRAVDPEIAINRVETFDQASADAIRLQTITADLFGLFGVIALAIAVSGVGGILALSVSRRVREIAIRMALGAKPANVLRMIIGNGMTSVLIGLVVGWAGAALLTSALTELLFGVTPTDPATFWGVSLLLLCAALVACYLPARRAVRIDPIVALRSE